MRTYQSTKPHTGQIKRRRGQRQKSLIQKSTCLVLKYDRLIYRVCADVFHFHSCIIHACNFISSVCSLSYHPRVCAPTGQVTAENLHPHADPGGRPSLWKDSDVLSHYLVKPPHLGSIVVAVALKDLRKNVKGEHETVSLHLMLNSLTSFQRQSAIHFCLVPKSV